MYFYDEQHNKNFERLLSLYPTYKHEDTQYLSTIYISAFPHIFRFIDLEKVNEMSSPIQQFIEKDEHDNIIVKEERLSNGGKALTRLAIALYDSGNINLFYTLGAVGTESWRKVILQSISISLETKL